MTDLTDRPVAASLDCTGRRGGRRLRLSSAHMTTRAARFALRPFRASPSNLTWAILPSTTSAFTAFGRGQAGRPSGEGVHDRQARRRDEGSHAHLLDAAVAERLLSCATAISAWQPRNGAKEHVKGQTRDLCGRRFAVSEGRHPPCPEARHLLPAPDHGGRLRWRGTDRNDRRGQLDFPSRADGASRRIRRGRVQSELRDLRNRILRAA